MLKMIHIQRATNRAASHPDLAEFVKDVYLWHVSDDILCVMDWVWGIDVLVDNAPVIQKLMHLAGYNVTISPEKVSL